MRPRPPHVVGNDVVDLAAPRTHGKHLDGRFVARVLAPEERSRLSDSPDAHLELWSLWAAKETAFKVASKLRPRIPSFEHARFIVRWEASRPPHGRRATTVRSGRVAFQELSFLIDVTARPGVLHAVGRPAGSSTDAAWVGQGLQRLEPDDLGHARDYGHLLADLTDREAASVHSLPSAAVRLAARADLAARTGHGEGRLEIVCDGPAGRSPPRVLLDGQPCPYDVSLAHDGAWIGWALSGPSGGS